MTRPMPERLAPVLRSPRCMRSRQSALQCGGLRRCATANGKTPLPPGEIRFVALRYKQPGATQSQRIETPITPGTSLDDDDFLFAAAIAGFGQLLRDPPYRSDWSWDEVINLAQDARGADLFGYRSAAITLMRLAQSLSTK